MLDEPGCNNKERVFEAFCFKDQNYVCNFIHNPYYSGKNQGVS